MKSYDDLFPRFTIFYTAYRFDTPRGAVHRMGSDGAAKKQESNRVEVINAVKTPLNFFVLVVIVVEAGLGGLAMKAEAKNQLIIIYLMVAVIAALIASVLVLAYKRPWDLVGAKTGTSNDREHWQELLAYCDKVSGSWWQQVEQERETAISFIVVTVDALLGTVSLDGRAYDRTGTQVAKWDSVSVCVNPMRHSVFYAWRGLYRTDANVEMEGFGTLTIHPPFTYGSTQFFDTNPSAKTSTRVSGELKRASKEQVRVVPNGPKEEVARVVREQLGVKTVGV